MSLSFKPADRQGFIGGSDARVIMGEDRPPCCASGGKNAAKSTLRTCPAT